MLPHFALRLLRPLHAVNVANGFPSSGSGCKHICGCREESSRRGCKKRSHVIFDLDTQGVSERWEPLSHKALPLSRQLVQIGQNFSDKSREVGHHVQPAQHVIATVSSSCFLIYFLLQAAQAIRGKAGRTNRAQRVRDRSEIGRALWLCRHSEAWPNGQCNDAPQAKAKDGQISKVGAFMYL